MPIVMSPLSILFLMPSNISINANVVEWFSLNLN